MTEYSIDHASRNLTTLAHEAAASQLPVVIHGPTSDVILIDRSVWDAMSETLYLVSIPGLRESIREGLETPISECGTDPGW